MNEEEVIIQLTGMKGEAECYGYKSDSEVLDYAINRIKADRWIPISERLPEKDGQFLICTSSGLIETTVFTFGQFIRPYVVAWKHLPEPYDWRTENG